MDELKVFSGNAHPALAKAVTEYLNIPLGNCEVFQFSNENSFVRILENVRSRDTFVIQPISSPVNKNLVELLIMLDALKRASAERITAVIPYYGYGRTDKKDQPRVPITARLIADLLTVAGANRLLTVDLHADQIQGFFDIPVDNIYATPVMLEDIFKQRFENFVVVSPDVGGVVRARAVAKRLDDADLAIIDKRRPKANVSQVMHIIGDVKDKTCILVDDIIDTAGTLCKAANALKEHGAARVVAYITHPVLSGPAIDNINASQLDELVVCDTIPLGDKAHNCDRIRVLGMAGLLAESIRRVSNEESISAMFENA